jgi:LmbE family N-acetylglucosaminyl deacetylase
MTVITVLSPHQDDAAFSLANTIAAAARAGQAVRIVNCFTRSEYAPYSPAENLCDIPAIRAREDREFASRIGGRIEIVDLDRADAPLRLGIPVSEVRRCRIGRSAREEAGWIADALARIDDGFLLAPLGLGSHVDHLIAADAALRLWRRGQPVGFYEDLPYAAEMRSCCVLRCVDRMARLVAAPLHAALVGQDAGAPRKRFAIEAYRSQVSAEQLQSVTGYGDCHGGERVWMAAPQVRDFPVRIDSIVTRSSAGAAAMARRLQCISHRAGERATAVLRHIVEVSSRKGGIHVQESN